MKWLLVASGTDRPQEMRLARLTECAWFVEMSLGLRQGYHPKKGQFILSLSKDARYARPTHLAQ